MTLNLTIINLLRRFKMRKYLLSTSAIAGVSLLSSLALADVAIKGSMEFQYSSTDSNVAANDGTATSSDAEVGITFTNKTDSGLNITFDNQFDTDAGTMDQHNLTISGGFGTIVMGASDGAEDKYSMNPGSVTQEETNASILTNTVSTTQIGTSTGARQDGDSTRVSYHLPAMGGLTAGISSATTLAGGADTTMMGMNYVMDAGGAAIKLGYSTATKEGAAKDTDSSSLGLQVVTNGITFSIAQGSYEATDEDQTTNSAGIGYTLANGLAIGAFTVKSEDDLDAGEEYTATHYEAAYTIASGLSAVVTVSDFDYENGTAADAGTADESGTITTLNIKASF
jgi:hypothetical protein